YSGYPGHAPYGSYGMPGCYGGYGGLDPNFTFGCHAGSGCAGYAPPGCAHPAPAECWCYPAMPPTDQQQEEELPKKDGVPNGQKPGPKPDAKPEGVFQQTWPNQAVVVVDVPAEAKLFLDGQPTGKEGKAHRTILTPQ